MMRFGSYVFKRAETSHEFEQIHRLNYRTFVGEIPQHPDPGGGRLIDKFHNKNSYFIALQQGQVVGMISGHGEPPFSVAERLPDPGILQAPGTRPLEVRLLAIEPGKRNGPVCVGLLWMLYHEAEASGYTHLFISGLVDRLPLYRRIGFEPLGPAVPCGKASFVPMVLTVGRLAPETQRTKELLETRLRLAGDPEPVCLLPGPVAMSERVREAFRQPPIYHRGPEFIALFQKVRRTLGELVGGRQVALLSGSGTLANEAVAALLAAGQAPGRGLLLVNGEFGQRLARQATRFGLQPRVLTWPWGQPWDLDEIDDALAREPAGWVWGVHLESSTGVLNDLPGLVGVARRQGARVCVDCVSSLGATPIDLEGVYLATGTSGKSLGSYAGVAIVFADARELARLDLGRVPSYFDVPAALQAEGPRYTFPSSPLLALDAALAEYATPDRARLRYQGYEALGQYVRRRLRGAGIEPLAAESCACPVVTTFAPPHEESSEEFVGCCRSWGFAIGGQSGYLAERRLVQIATMGTLSREDFAPLFDHLARRMARRPELVSR